MNENTNLTPNEQGGVYAAANDASDWRSRLQPELRNKVISQLVGKLKQRCSTSDEARIIEVASKIEEKTYTIAIDKYDYIRKLNEKMRWMERTHNNAQFGSSVNGANTLDPAAQVVMNQAQSLPASLPPYTQNTTSQNWLPQNTQSNLNIPGSSHLPTQGHTSILPGSQRVMHGRQHHLPQQQQAQQYQMNQHLLNGEIYHGNLQSPHMQQQAQPPQQQHHPQSLLKQPIQQSFSQSSALSSLPSSGQQTSIQQNSQLLSAHQLPTQRVRYTPQQQMVLPVQEHKQLRQEKLISQMMNVPNTQQNHPTSRQNIGQQEGGSRVLLSQQNNVASFQAMPQHNTNYLQNIPLQRLDNSSAFPSQQQQNMLDCQSGNFNVSGLSLVGTQCQEVGQSQPMMSQQYRLQYPMQQQPQNRSSRQHLDSVHNDSQRFQAASSLHQTQNIANQQNHPHQSQIAPLPNPSTSQDSTRKTVNATGDWQEETYQKIKAMKEMYLPVLSTTLQKVKEKLLQIESHPPQKILSEQTQKLKAFKSSLEQVMVYLNVHRSRVSEKHRDHFGVFKYQILKLTNIHMLQRSKQQQQGNFPPPQIHQTTLQSQSPQVHMLQSLEKDQMNSRSMSSNQNGPSSSVYGPRSTSDTSLLGKRPKLEPRDENNIMASSGNVMLPSLLQNPASNPQHVQSNNSSVQPSMFQPKQQKQLHHRQIQQPQIHRQQQQQQTQQGNQQLQIPNSHETNEMNDVLMRQGDINTQLLQQNLSPSQCQLPKALSNVTPSASSPQIQHHSSPRLVDQQILPATVNLTGTSSKYCSSPSVAQSPTPVDAERPISVECRDSGKLSTQEHVPISLSPESITERPIDRLIKAVQSASPKSLAESVSEMRSVISMVHRSAGSFHPDGRSRAALGEDLSEKTKSRFQKRNLMTHRESNLTKRIKRVISAVPQDIASQTDGDKQLSSLESEDCSTESYGSKPGCALLQEIREINGRLIETMVEICDEDTSGTIVTCSYTPVALSASFKDLYNSGNISQIKPLRLLVPANYPYSSPRHLEEVSLDTSVHSYENLCARTRSRFGLSMRTLSEPMSLKEVVQTWNDCARATMVEYAERHGGGTFSSKYGGWETVQRAS